MKIIWRVASVPVGRFKSIHRRGWPCAYENNPNTGRQLATLHCDDAYTTPNVRSGSHAVITVRIMTRNEKWKTLKKRAKTWQEAKYLVVKFFADYPDF